MHSGEISVGPFAPQHHDSLSRRGSHEYSPPPLDSTQRKRTYSTISNEFSSPAYQAQRPPMGWADPPRHLPPPQSGYQSSPPVSNEQNQPAYRPAYSPNGLAPQPAWRAEPDLAIRPNASYDAASQAEQNHTESKLKWNDAIIDG